MIVVSYRTPSLTVAAVQSAVAAGAHQVVVVDNDSGDGTIALLAAMDEARLLVVERADNEGFGVAANAGAKRATADILIFLNSDATLTPPTIAALRDEVARFDGQCVAGARLVDPEGMVQPSAGLLPAPADLTVRALGIHAIVQFLRRAPVFNLLVGRSRLAVEYSSALVASEPFDTSSVSGACFAIGRKAFGAVRFDERFFLYFEDADFCRRAGEAGMRIRYVPAAVVPHIGGASSSEDYHFGPAHARSMRQYLEKWYGPAGAVLALALLWLRAMGFTLALRPQAGRAWKALHAAW